MATALLAFAAGGCVEPLDPSQRGPIDPDAVSLPIRLYIPGAMPATKALTGDVESITPESQIYSVQVWMFDHPAVDEEEVTVNNKTAVAYAEAFNITANTANLGPYDQSGYYPTWVEDKIFQLPLLIPGYVMERKAANLKFDFYVLANAASIGSKVGRETTRGSLKALTFGYTSATDDPFGSYDPKTGNPMTGPTPTDALTYDGVCLGLPISGFFNKSKNTNEGAQSPYVGDPKGVDLSFLKENLTDDEIRAKTPVVQLERAVSKIRFAFVRPKGLEGVQITKIVIDEKRIPDQTFVFPREDGTDGTSGYNYNNTPIITIQGELNDDNTRKPLFKDTDIKEMTEATPDPASLVSTSPTAVPGYSVTDPPKNMTAEQYSALLDAYTTSQLVYLRESGLPITGTIYYRLPGMEADAKDITASFDMSQVKDYDASTTNFHRNHSWTVYGYFLGGDLYVDPTVSDWEDAAELKYTLNMSTNMRLFDSWLYRYDTDGDLTTANYTNWETSHMAVSSGRATATNVEPVAGRPLRSPQIQLVTTGSGTYKLMVDNDKFEIIRANKNATGVVTGYESSTNGELTILAPVSPANEVYTYFYIVPKEGEGVTPPTTSDEKVAKVSLIYNDPVLGPQKVTFNYGALPGYSDDSSEIWAYYFPENQYNITGKLKMYYQDNNNPLVPTPVQN